MPTQIGERYQCTLCQSTFMVTRPGTGSLFCCGQPMTLTAASSAQRPPTGPSPDSDEEEEDLW